MCIGATARFSAIIPEDRDHPFDASPWASIRSGFLLARPTTARSHVVQVEVDVPQRAELYPFELLMRINGTPAATLHLESTDQAGTHWITGRLPALEPEDWAIEVVLETRSYFSGIDDHRMKSFRLRTAAVAAEKLDDASQSSLSRNR